MARTALTALAVSKLKAPEAKSTRVEKYDGLVRGFGVRVTPEGSKSWIFVYTSPTRAKRRRYTIGDVVLRNPADKSSVNLEEARAEAYRLRQLVREGRDPADERENKVAVAISEAQAAAANTFSAVVELYEKRDLGKKRRGWEVKRIIDRELIPHWGRRPLASITPIDVQERVEALVDAGKPEAARRLFEIIRRVFNWAIARPSYKLDRSPADRMKPAELVGDKVKRKRTLTNDELAALWNATDSAGYPFGPLVRLLMLSALRRNEAAEARWPEFDVTSGIWVIPPSRMKGDAAHVVPLTAETTMILKSLPRFTEGGDFLFSSGDGQKPISGFSQMKRRLDKLMLAELRRLAAARGEDPAKIELERWVLHDIRRTVRTHMSALPVPEIVRELILAHAQSGLHAVYDQHQYIDEKRDALTLWAARLKDIIDPPVGNVVVMRRA